MTAPLSQHGPAGEALPGVGPGEGNFDKSKILREYANRFPVKTLVETGLYQGHGSGDWFPGVYVAIDWQAENCDRLLQRRPDAIVRQGDSAFCLREMLSDEDYLPAPVLFWLDAHALSEDEGAPQVCPLLGELDAIMGWPHAVESVVLIDDLWAMGSLRGWPSLDELRDAADRGPWLRSEEGGIMRLTPSQAWALPLLCEASARDLTEEVAICPDTR